MRGSKTKNKKKAKVIEAKIIAPDKTLKEIQKETWVPKSTISDIIRDDLPEIRNSSEIIAKLIDDNNKILNITWRLLVKKLKDGEKVRIDEIIKSRDLALKQNTLVWLSRNEDRELIIKFEI